MSAVDRLRDALDGRYAIGRELGAGGMATVYLAEDVRHGRKVAIKVLHPELSAIIGAERFLAEIRLTAQLQHPHVLGLIDSGECDGLLYYVMPFVEGETLRGRLARERQLPVEDAVRLAREVAAALEYAHKRGIVHRDIKPENVLLQDGAALVADFGIALAVSHAGGNRLTQTGLSLGTPSYMSPEQAMGEREISPRSDVYALGAMTYEMLAGEPPFTGTSAQAIVARVLTEEPRAITTQRRTVPPHVEGAVLRALEKLPADRWGSVKEFADALVDGSAAAVRAGMARTVPMRAAAAPRDRRALLWPGVAAALGALALWGWLRARPEPPLAPLERHAVTFDRAARLVDAVGSPIALSPDGTVLVFTGQDSLGTYWLLHRRLDQERPTILPGTRSARAPFFSHDGSAIAFVQDGKLRRMTLPDGAVTAIADAPGSFGGGTWGPDDVIVISDFRRLLRVPAGGGPLDTLPSPDSTRHLRWPDLLPGGRAVLVTIVPSGGSSSQGAALGTVSLDDGAVTPLGRAGHSPRWVEGGWLTWSSNEGVLLAAPFDPVARRITGAERPLAENVRSGPAAISKSGVARRTGRFAYMSGPGSRRLLERVSWDGAVTSLPIPPDFYAGPRVSPDGTRLLFGRAYAGYGTGDHWTYDLRTGSLARLTFDSLNGSANWWPDGRSIVFLRRDRSGAAQTLLRLAADGSGRLDTLVSRPNLNTDVAIAPDGRRLVFLLTPQGFARDLWVMPVGFPDSARPLTQTPYDDRGPAISPDGGWLAYVSNETGRDAVYVRTLDGDGARWAVSTGTTHSPSWSPDGRELRYLQGDTLFAVPVETAPAFRTGRPRPLFVGSIVTASGVMRQYDPLPDGSGVVLVRDSEASSFEVMHMVANWIPSRGSAP